ncbi:MAG: ABC transporter permease [Candidatus Hodarchaeales archaeon]
MLDSIVWITLLISPILGSLIFFIITTKYRDIDVKKIAIISLLIVVGLTILGIVSGILFFNMEITIINKILGDWYWFLFVLSPLAIIGAYLIRIVTRESLKQFTSTVIAISIALFLSSFLILFAQAYTNPDLINSWIQNPLKMVDVLLNAGKIILNSSFGLDDLPLLIDGDPTNDYQFYQEIGRTLGLATPLIFTGLVFAVSAKAGLFNIGAEGAFTLGGFVGAVIGVWLPKMIPFSLPPMPYAALIHLPLAFGCAAIVGAIFGFIPGVLRAYLGAHEVITTIMLNPIAGLIVFMLVRDYYTVPDLRTETPPVLESAQLPHLLDGPLGMEYFIAIIIAVILYLFLFKTSYGLEMRAVGTNVTAAEYAGVPVKKRQVQAMTIGGAIGAIGGAGMSLGYYYYFNPSHPLGIIAL